MNFDAQKIFSELNSPVDKVRLDAVRQLGNSGQPSKEIFDTLEKVKKSDKNKFVRYAAKRAINRLNAVLEITGTDRPLSELTDRELLERLLILQVENKKSISSTQALFFILFNFIFLILWLTTMKN